MLNTLKDKKDGSLNFLHGEGAASSVENAGISYQSASLLAAGGTARDVAVLSSFSNLIFALLLVKVPSLVRFGDALKRSVVILSIISSLGWLPLVFVTIFAKGISPTWLIVLWVISLVPDFLIGPLRDKWLSDLVPSRRVGRYLSLRSIISAGTYLSCFYVMGYSLDHFQTGIFGGFTLIFMLAFLASMVSLILYLIIKVSVPAGERAQSNIGLVGFVREARQNELGTFIVFTALVMFTASISGAFFSVYMLKDLHFSYLIFTLVISSEFVARIISSYLWGKLIDSSGAIKVLRTASILIPFIPILWLFSANVGYLMSIQVLSGTAWAAFDLCTQSYLFRASPPDKRLHYIVYHRSIITLASAIGPLLGVGLLNVMPPVFGNAILGIFLLSGALRLVVVIAVLPRLKTDGSREPESGETSGEFRPAPVENQSLSDWEPCPSGVKVIRAQVQPQNKNGNYRAMPTEGRTLRVRVDTSPASSLGQAFRWADYESRLNSPETRQHQGMLYHPELWSPAGVKAAPEKVARLSDNLPRDIEYHKRWAARVTC
jgi:predicted MFS family arabinose efflux permease